MTTKAKAIAALRNALPDETPELISGYTDELSDNLVLTVRDKELKIRDQLGDGDGGELKDPGDGRRARAHAPHSSAIAAANTFAWWMGREDSLRLGELGGFEQGSLVLEKKLPIFRGGRPPNLDAYASAPGSAVGVESKLTEVLSSKAPGEWSKAYSRPDCEALLQDGWLEALRTARAGRSSYKYLDADQLVKHALGLRKQHPDDTATHLVYLYWEPRNDDPPEVAAHRGELTRFFDQVGGAEPTLHAISFAQLWEQWDGLEVDGLQAHVAALRKRYDVPLSG